MKLQMALLTSLLACTFAARAGDPWTLEQALDYAFAHNPDARIAEQHIAAAQAGLEQANSAFWPQLQVESNYTRTNNPILAFGSILNQQSYTSSFDFNNAPTIDNFNVKGIVTVPLYSGGRNTAGAQFARDFFPQIRLFADSLEAHAVQHQSRGFQSSVVATDAILLNRSLRERCGFRGRGIVRRQIRNTAGDRRKRDDSPGE